MEENRKLHEKYTEMQKQAAEVVQYKGEDMLMSS
jgi:hypothetical protein